MLHSSQLSTPVLFIPGALTGEWIWEGNFSDYFKTQGYSVHTFSFPGHGASFIKRNSFGFEDYLAACVEKIISLPAPPILIAHSLGGLIALHAATKVNIDRLILLSPVPASGMLKSILQLGLKSPVSVLKFASVLVDARVAKYAEAPLGVYSETCDIKQRKTVTHQLKGEALLVALRLLSPPKLNKQKLNTNKILFIGATGDHIIPATEVSKSANDLEADLLVYEGMSHTFQIEKDWPKIAEDIFLWIKEHKKVKERQEVEVEQTGLKFQNALV